MDEFNNYNSQHLSILKRKKFNIFPIIDDQQISNLHRLPLKRKSVQGELFDFENEIKKTKNNTHEDTLIEEEPIKLKNHTSGRILIDSLHLKSCPVTKCTSKKCSASISANIDDKPKPKDVIYKEAFEFINEYYKESKQENTIEHMGRVKSVKESLEKTGTYELTYDELCFGAKLAWRNAPRCIGRIQWSQLRIFDARHIDTAEKMFEAVCDHLRYSSNNGILRSAITLFRQRTAPLKDFRVWNKLFVSYAGYEKEENVVIGDRGNVELTKMCMRLGWIGKGTEFDVLPIVVQANGEEAKWFQLHDDLALQVDIVHPTCEAISELKMKWYGMPGVSNMMLDIGGLQFTAAPFNGWYMGTEVGRDLSDVNRYNKLPLIAQKLGLDTRSNKTLWKDKALIELNQAILYSFQRRSITITDHHSASEAFLKHFENEKQLRGGCPADWVWLVPSVSAHLTPLFHLEMLNYHLKPSYNYQEDPWKCYSFEQRKSVMIKPARLTLRKFFIMIHFSMKLVRLLKNKKPRIAILYATETGKSEEFAYKLAKKFKSYFTVNTQCMVDYDTSNISNEKLVFIVASTFGNGDAPENGKSFFEFLTSLKMSVESPLQDLLYSVFALGNSSYPTHCGFGKRLDALFGELKAKQLHQLVLGDELNDQEDTFHQWSRQVFKKTIDKFNIEIDETITSDEDDEEALSRLALAKVEDQLTSKKTTAELLAELHNKQNIFTCKLKKRRNLEDSSSDRKTLKISLDLRMNVKDYNIGDHIALFPANRLDIVETVINQIDTDSLPKLADHNPYDELGSKRIIHSLARSLTYFCDLTTPPTQKFLSYLETEARAESDKNELNKLVTDVNEYKRWKSERCPHLAEILQEFPSIVLNATVLISKLPKLQPRYYSISSSPKAYRDQIDLTVKLVEYMPKSGKQKHYGVCSKWLEEIKEDEPIYAFLKPTTFKLPSNKLSSVIMIGAGSGIAPFRSFWQDRYIEKFKANNSSSVLNKQKCFGDFSLYFGCRNSKNDELYKDEIQQLVNTGVITKYHVAYSREPNHKKTYVQDVLLENMKSVYNAIINENAHFYVCGDIGMADGVDESLVKIIKSEGRVTTEEALAIVKELKDKSRYQLDIFGSNSNTTSSNEDTPI